MRRREFIAGTAITTALSFAKSVYAQTDARSPGIKRIAIVHNAEKPEGMTINGRRTFKAYFGELKRLGYVEGQNLLVDRYSALGQSERYGDLARTIVASHPDLIIAVSGPLARQLKLLTTTIPILVGSGDPVAGGLVTNLARPGGNITGVSVDAGLGVYDRRLQFLGETVRNLRNVRVLIPSSAMMFWETGLAPLREAAGGVGIRIAAALLGEKLDRAAHERVFDEMETDRVDGLMVAHQGENLTNRQLIADLAAKHRLPAVYPHRDFVDVGGLLSYGSDLEDVMRRLADMTDQVMKGAKPADIPVYQQTKFELVLNRTTAKSLGLEFPVSLLAVADEVIE
jgi:putative tryptophan/tyrosine transport system substrate-binding protein